MNSLVYVRVSSGSQATDDRQSLPAQYEDAAAWCAAHDLTIVGSFEDVESGTHAQREQYQSMLTRARKGDVQAIVIREFARFGRERWEAIQRVAELISLGVEIHEYGDGNIIRREDDNAFLSTAFRAYSADRASQETRRNAKRGQLRALSQGQFMGLAPYGYQKDGKTVIPLPREAKVVRDIFTWYAHENRSLMSIARRLNLAKIPARRGPWSASTLSHLLKREAYIGTWTWAGEPMTIPALISPDLFALARERMQRKVELPFGKTQTSGYLLSGLIKCDCGSAMVGFTPKRGEGQRGYRCGRSRLGLCPAGMVRADEVEQAVITYLTEHLQPVLVRQAAASDAERLEQEAASIRAERQAIVKRRDDLIRQALRGKQADLISAFAEDELASVDQTLASVEASLQSARARILTASSIANRARSLREAVEISDPQQAKSLVQSLVKSIRIPQDRSRPIEVVL